MFRGMTTEQLQDLYAQFMEQWIALGPFGSETVANKSFTVNVAGLKANLEAIQYVLNERGAGSGTGAPGTAASGMGSYFVYDFSQGTSHGQPAGSTDQLSY